MKNITITAILFIIFIVNSNTFAQKKLDYKDVYDVVLSKNNEKAYTLLLAYQKQEPDFANTYFQLGLIAKQWAKEFNPFTEFVYTKFFIYNTKLYFNLAKFKLEKEKKKNINYYTNIKIATENKKLSVDDITGFIEEQVEEIKIYEENIIQIITYFNKSSDKYNECVDIFMDINREYSKIKNIYLTQEKEFLLKTEKLESNFDSTIYYFEQYKNATDIYPIAGYDQKYILKDIITYRLDGLTNSNFLENNFSLWNYKKWVRKVKETKNVNVSENRNDIFSVDSLMKSKINQLLKSDFSDLNKPYKLNEKLVYKIEKFDNNSLLVKLFKLNETKINYLTLVKKTVNDTANSDKFSLFQYAQYCNILRENKIISDSLNKNFRLSINAEQIRKYKNFYLSEYNGMTGLKDYTYRQELFFQEKQDAVFENLKKKLFETEYDIKNDTFFYINKLTDIKKAFVNKQNINTNEYYISDFIIDKNNKLTVSGFYKTKKGNLAGFTGQTENMKKFKVFKKSNISDTSDIINALIEDFKGGYFTIETSIGKSIVNTLIKYSGKGQIIMTKKLPYNKVPRIMKFDDINNSLIIVFNGYKIDVLKTDDDEQIIYRLNLDDDLQSYAINIKAKAYIFDIIKMDTRIFLFSNYLSYIDLAGNEHVSSAGNSMQETNILLTIISQDGFIEKHVPVEKDKAFFGTNAIKLNSNTINVLGYFSPYINKNYDVLTKKELYYLIINSDAEILYSTWHD
ncbi:MAG: hypothetical protein K8R54_15915 [Bacteroidales bacterium]|nr:hypothetical protein [Bacteroidales bacterium]